MQKCVFDIDEIYKKAPFVYDKSLIESQHAYEKEHIYRKILGEVYQDARQRIDTIASEVLKFGSRHDCEDELSCRVSIEAKISEIEAKYENVVETSRVLFMEQENNYKERIQDYCNILETAMKPFNLLADQCLQKHLRNNVDMFSYNNLVSK